MQFKVKQQDLVEKLSIVSSACAKKAIQPLLTSILMEANKEKSSLTLRATNTVSEIMITLPVIVEKSGSCCVDSILPSILANYEPYSEDKNNYLEFNLDSQLQIEQGNRKLSVSVQSAKDFPEKIETGNDWQQVNSSDLLKMFKIAAIGVANNSDNKLLECYYLNLINEVVYSSDKLCILEYKTEFNIKQKSILPLRLVDSLNNILVKNESVLVTFGTYSSVKSLDSTYQVTLNGYDANFPSVDKILSQSRKNEVKLQVSIDKSHLVKSLNICKLYEQRAIQEGKSSHTVFNRNGDNCTLQMEIPDFSNMIEPLLVSSMNGEVEYSLWFSSSKLLDFINSVDTNTIVITMFDSNKPFLVNVEGNDNITYLQVPYTSNK